MITKLFENTAMDKEKKFKTAEFGYTPEKAQEEIDELEKKVEKDAKYYKDFVERTIKEINSPGTKEHPTPKEVKLPTVKESLLTLDEAVEEKRKFAVFGIVETKQGIAKQKRLCPFTQKINVIRNVLDNFDRENTPVTQLNVYNDLDELIYSETRELDGRWTIDVDDLDSAEEQNSYEPEDMDGVLYNHLYAEFERQANPEDERLRAQDLKPYAGTKNKFRFDVESQIAVKDGAFILTATTPGQVEFAQRVADYYNCDFQNLGATKDNTLFADAQAIGSSLRGTKGTNAYRTVYKLKVTFE